ncbi:MAG: hypothetical protein IPJ88_02895 [Myxococcales bacterium]|nr:MAG: hypothetical protein IPJ88_02895 [Myxococcales bacterium]
MARLNLLFALFLLSSSCQFIADFDRSKIGQDASVDGDASLDGSSDANTNPDGNTTTDSGTSDDSGTTPIGDAGGDV